MGEPAEALEDSGQIDFASVPADQVHMVWPFIEPMVRKFYRRTDGNELRAGEMLSRIMYGDWTLWAVIQHGQPIGGLVFSVEQIGPDRKIWVHMLAGVKMREWAEGIQNLLQDFRVLVGAKSIGATSRPGMEKLGLAMGWKRKAIVMELGNG